VKNGSVQGVSVEFSRGSAVGIGVGIAVGAATDSLALWMHRCCGRRGHLGHLPLDEASNQRAASPYNIKTDSAAV